MPLCSSLFRLNSCWNFSKCSKKHLQYSPLFRLVWNNAQRRNRSSFYRHPFIFEHSPLCDRFVQALVWLVGSICSNGVWENTGSTSKKPNLEQQFGIIQPKRCSHLDMQVTIGSKFQETERKEEKYLIMQTIRYKYFDTTRVAAYFSLCSFIIEEN